MISILAMSILLGPKNRQNLGMIVTSFSDFFLTPVSTASTFSSYFVSFAQRPPISRDPTRNPTGAPGTILEFPWNCPFVVLLSPFHPVSSVAFGLKFVFSLVFTVKPRNQF